METPTPAFSEAPSAPSEGVLLAANLSDVSEIARVMEEASGFKRSHGDDLWGEAPFTEQEVTGMVASGNMFVYKIDDEVAASVILLKDDARMWGEAQGEDGSALYIHKLVTGNASRGQGVGGKVISLAEEIAGQNGRTKMRLDCPYDNEGLYDYYIGLGFHEVRRYDRPASPGRRTPIKMSTELRYWRKK